MKIVFLDVDGVLNSAHWWKVRTGVPEEANKADYAHYSIDPSAVLRLNRLLDESGAVCVLSSTWRTMYPLPDMQSHLVRRGFTGRLLGATPNHASHKMVKDERGRWTRRGNEIQAWLNMLGPKNQPGSFVILDDDDDMAHLANRLVKTKFDHGLTDENVNEALEVLNHWRYE
jgi:hypothetical protein